MATVIEKTTPEARWLPSQAVASLIGRDTATVARLGREGHIRRHKAPGVRPLYNLADAMRFAPPRSE